MLRVLDKLKAKVNNMEYIPEQKIKRRTPLAEVDVGVMRILEETFDGDKR
jgi:hypothetical protein